MILDDKILYFLAVVATKKRSTMPSVFLSIDKMVKIIVKTTLLLPIP